MLQLLVRSIIIFVFLLAWANPLQAATQEQQQDLALDILGQLANTAPQNFRDQRRLLERIIDQCPDTGQAHDAYWQLAAVYQRYMGLPDHTAIAELFEKYLKRYPNSAHAPQARRDLVFSYEKLGQWDKVAAFYKQILKGRQLTDSEVMLDGLSYAQALERTGNTSEAARWYALVLERDRGMNSYAAQIARRKLNHLAADGVIEPQPKTTRDQTPQPVSGPPTPKPTPYQPEPNSKDTIETVTESTTKPPRRPVVVPVQPSPTPQAFGQPGFKVECKLVKARSFRDKVGRGVNRPDGSPDAHLRLKLGPGVGILTSIELRAKGRISGYWSTGPARGAWPMAVMRGGKSAGGAGRPLHLAIGPKGGKLDLLVQDNNAIASGATMTLFINTSGGSRYQVAVQR